MLIAKTYLTPTLFNGVYVHRGNGEATSKQKLKVAFNSVAGYIFNLKKTDHVSLFSYKIFYLNFNDWTNARALQLLHTVPV